MAKFAAEMCTISYCESGEILYLIYCTIVATTLKRIFPEDISLIFGQLTVVGKVASEIL